jgi:hypothetical protein
MVGISLPKRVRVCPGRAWMAVFVLHLGFELVELLLAIVLLLPVFLGVASRPHVLL